MGEVTNQRLKTIEKLKPPVLKVVAVTYERWSNTRVFNYNDFTGKTFGGRTWTTVLHKREGKAAINRFVV